MCKMFNETKGVLILIIFAGYLGIFLTEALQCYDCYDCEDGDDLNELQICGEFPNKPTTRRTTTTTTKTTNNNADDTTRAPGNIDDDDDLDEPSDEDVVRKTTLRPGNTIPPKRKTTRTTRRTTKADDSDENDDDDDDDSEDEELRRLRGSQRQAQSRADVAVCYMVQLIVNDTVIMNRGCATMVRGNNLQTCKALSSGWNLNDCQLCDTDGCNRFADDDGSWEEPWNGAGQLETGAWFLLTAILLKMLL